MVVQSACELSFAEVSSNFLVCDALKTHLQKVDFLEVCQSWVLKNVEVDPHLFFSPCLPTTGSGSFATLVQVSGFSVGCEER